MLTILKLKGNGKEITLEIIRSARKTMAIEIKENLRVSVRIPSYLSDKQIKEFVNTKKDWIITKYEQMAEKKYKEKNGFKGNPYYDGARLPLLDSFLLLHIIKAGEENGIWMEPTKDKEGQIHLTLTTLSENKEVLRMAVLSFYKRYAKANLIKIINQYANQMDVTFGRVSVRDQKTRWGSCSSRGNLNFNWKLMMMPEKIVDYIVIHELAHRKQMNHSAAFWKEVELVVPDYKERLAWLRQHEKELVIY